MSGDRDLEDLRRLRLESEKQYLVARIESLEEDLEEIESDLQDLDGEDPFLRAAARRRRREESA